MKKLFSLLLALTLVVTCLAGVSFAADPVARIINGDKVVELEAPLQDEKFEALISPEGTTVIEILKDFRTSEFGMWSPYTVTIDLKGHKITTGRNGLHVEAAGSVNSQTVINSSRPVHDNVVELFRQLAAKHLHMKRCRLSVRPSRRPCHKAKPRKALILDQCLLDAAYTLHYIIHIIYYVVLQPQIQIQITKPGVHVHNSNLVSLHRQSCAKICHKHCLTGPAFAGSSNNYFSHFISSRVLLHLG